MDWSSFWGAFIGNVADIAIIFMLIKLARNIKESLKDFKEEGEDDLYLK